MQAGTAYRHRNGGGEWGGVGTATACMMMVRIVWTDGNMVGTMLVACGGTDVA